MINFAPLIFNSESDRKDPTKYLRHFGHSAEWRLKAEPQFMQLLRQNLRFLKFINPSSAILARVSLSPRPLVGFKSPQNEPLVVVVRQIFYNGKGPIDLLERDQSRNMMIKYKFRKT